MLFIPSNLLTCTFFSSLLIVTAQFNHNYCRWSSWCLGGCEWASADPQLCDCCAHDDFTSASCTQCAASAVNGAKPSMSLEEKLMQFPPDTTAIRCKGWNLYGPIPSNLSQRFPNLKVLDLSSNDVSGEIPDSVWSLSSLRELYLDNNAMLQGELSEIVGQAKQLVSLGLSSTKMSGGLPDSVGNWSLLSKINIRKSGFSRLPDSVANWRSVQCVDMSENKLGGALPKAVSGWSNLRYLNLKKNALSGALPDEVGSWQQVEGIDLGGNRFSGALPATVGSWSNSKELWLDWNAFSGNLPREVGNWRNVEVVNIRGNRFDGPIPSVCGSWSKAKFVWMSENSFSGEVPVEVGNWKNVQSVNIGSNKLTGALPAVVGAWWDVRIFYCYVNSLTSLPDEIGNWTKIELAYFQNNQLAGSLTESVGQWTNVKTVWLNVNRLTGTLPAGVGNWRTVREVDFQHNQLTGLPSTLGNWANVENVKLNHNLLPNFPEGVSMWRAVKTVQLNNNKITGPIPDSVSGWQAAAEVKLSSNLLDGAIPAAVGSWSNVQKVLLDGNMLSGDIPDSVGHWGQILEVNLANNRLSGPLPKSVQAWSMAKTIILENNQLSGDLPLEVGQWLSVVTLRLAKNKLTGPLPVSIGNWTSLQTLDLQSNAFSALPAEMARLENAKVVYLQNNSFQGSLPDLGAMLGLTELHATMNSFNWTGSLPPKLTYLDLSHNELTTLPRTWDQASELLFLSVAHNRIVEWPPNGTVNKMRPDGTYTCGMQPLANRFRFLKLRRLVADGNPMKGSARYFLNSLAYLPDLRELSCRNCGLGGVLHPEASKGLADDMEHTGWRYDCTDAAELKEGFMGLQGLDLSGNAISEILAKPSQDLLYVNFSNNTALEKMEKAWFNLEVENKIVQLWIDQNPKLRVHVEPPASTCALLGTRALVANPDSYIPTSEGYECASPCPGVYAKYNFDVDLDEMALCRCQKGYHGKGRNCTRCGKDAYSISNDTYGLISECRACPANSHTGDSTAVSDISGCMCKAGSYMDAGTAACLQCDQWPFRTTASEGASSKSACTCNPSYKGLKEFDGRCGCSDGYYMNHVARECQRCTIAEICTWGTEISQSLQPPRVKRGYWAEPTDVMVTFAQNSIWRCTSGLSCLENGTCAKGRVGHACALCGEGMHGGPDGDCKPCSGELSKEARRWLAAVGMLLVFVPIVILEHLLLTAQGTHLGYILHMRAMRASLKQMVKHVQTIGVIGKFSVAWPPIALALFEALERLSLKIPTLLQVGCLDDQTSAFLEMGAKWSLPPVFIICTLCAIPISWVLSLAVKKLIARLRGTALGSRLESVLPIPGAIAMDMWDGGRVLLFTSALFWTTLVANSFEAITCDPSPNGRFSLATFPNVQCSLKNTEFVVLGVGSLFACAAYMLLPIRVCSHAQHEALCTLANTARADRGWYGFLFDDFRDGHLHWVRGIMVKDALFVLVPAALPGQGAAQLLITAAVCCCFIAFVVRSSPYRDRSNSLLEIWNGATAAAICFYTVGMGYEKTVGMAEVEALFQDGADDALYRGRAVGMVVVQVIAISVPAVVLVYQLLCAVERTRRMLPTSVQPLSQEESAAWLQDFLVYTDVKDAVLADILKDFDEVDLYDFRTLFEQTPATMGHQVSRTSMSRLVKMAMRRASFELPKDIEAGPKQSQQSAGSELMVPSSGSREAARERLRRELKDAAKARRHSRLGSKESRAASARYNSEASVVTPQHMSQEEVLQQVPEAEEGKVGAEYSI